MWSSMLDSVASGKKLQEKNLIVLGGTPQVQRDFLQTLASDVPKRPADRHRKKPLTANQLALGYTYQDVLDADHEDTLARLSIYLMSDSSPEFGTLLKPLITSQTIPETLLAILLDWNEPWSWAHQLKAWINLIHTLLNSLDQESEATSEVVMKEWKSRRRGGTGYDISGSGTGTESLGNVNVPLGEGEWDFPLGLPLSVICHNADKISSLEIDRNWREEDFDFILQLLRTILLKHGASLIYTSNSSPNSLPVLIHSSLGIYSSLKKQAVKHNVIDRDKILVPPNWDSFGKIRVLREGFDAEKISSLWAKDISDLPETSEKVSDDQSPNNSQAVAFESVVAVYNSVIPDPSKNRPKDSSKTGIDVSIPSHQSFLSNQQEVIERLKAEEAKSASADPSSRSTTFSGSGQPSVPDRMNDQIGPVQVNMGGIQVDAGDVLRRLKSGRDASTPSSVKVGAADGEDPGTPASAMATPEREMKAQNEALNNFFTGLMKRGASGSPRNTPTQDGKKGTPKDKGKDESGKRLFTKE